MAISTRTDPLRNFKFRVSIQHPGIGGIAKMGFASMSGISVQNEMIPYREGGWNTSPHKMVGQSDYAPVSLSKGVMPLENQLWEWQKYIHYFQWGQGNLSDPTAYRCDAQIDIFDHPITKNVSEANPGPTRLRIQLDNVWPGAFAFNELDATSNALLIHQITLHHEGFTVDWL
jgi:phage tail-like protein